MWIDLNIFVAQAESAHFGTKLVTEFIITDPTDDHRRVPQLMTVESKVKGRTASARTAGEEIPENFADANDGMGHGILGASFETK